MEDYRMALEYAKGALGTPSVLSKYFQEQQQLADEILSLKTLSAAEAKSQKMSKLVETQEKDLKNKLSSAINSSALTTAISAQAKAILCIGQGIKTPNMEALLQNFEQANWTEGMDDFVKSLTKGYTRAADVALLKNVKELEQLTPSGYTSQINTFLKKMRKRTGERLLQDGNVEADVVKGSLRSRLNKSSVVNVETMNEISYATEIFTDIKENELIVFVDWLSDLNEIALKNSTGKKISEIIENWDNFIDFDCDYYYHARESRENGCSFTREEMGKAPREKVRAGRYNHVNQSHYYFSDTQLGAETEVKKHSAGVGVQVARLKPKREIRMIDLSGETTANNIFMQHLRYEPSPESINPVEYLLPQFVATCCKGAGIEGIKYYGSKKYKNYVSWSGDYFDVELVWPH